MNEARRRLLAAAGALAAGAAQTEETAPATLRAEVPGARLQGRALLRFMGLRIYEARLWSGAAPVPPDGLGAPFALELQYARDFKGTQIAERSLAEMRRQGEIKDETAARWLALLKQLVPDVQEGDRLAGIHRPGQGMAMLFNDKPQGETRDLEFTQRFFGIWLSPRTSEPALRLALLGLSS